MKPKTSKITIAAALAILAIAAIGMSIDSDDSDAVETSVALGTDTVAPGASYSKTLSGYPGLINPQSLYTLSGASWLSFTLNAGMAGSIDVTGTAPSSGGTYNVSVTGPFMQGSGTVTWSWAISVQSATVYSVSVKSGLTGGVTLGTWSVASGALITLPTSGYAISGYHCTGYYSALSGGSLVGQPGDQIAIYNSRTIYAQYTQIITYTVTLDLNGALYLPNYPSQVPTISSISGMYNGGETYNLATNTANMQSDKVFANAAGSPSMQGRFLGWSESPSGSVIGYSTFTVTSNKTLYAIWDTTTAVISFDVNGGTGSVAPISTTVGQEYTLPGANGISNGELMLLGWSLTSDGAETISSGVTQTAVGNAKWYAQWGAGTSPIASFIYSVNGLEVTFTDTSIAPNIWQWAFGDTTISTSQNPVHTYPAAGTYTVTQAVSNATGLSSSFSAAVTVGGSADVTYIVTFDANGGTAAEPIQCAGGGVITLPETTKSGVTFAGWCLSEIFVGNAGSLYTVNGDVTLTAAWLSGSVSVHSVVFKIDGQTVATQKVADGGVATHFSAEQSGKTFDGWYITDPEIFGGNVQLYSFATPVTKDITLDAHFTDNPLIDLHDIKTQVAIVITILIVIVAVAAVIRWMR